MNSLIVAVMMAIGNLFGVVNNPFGNFQREANDLDHIVEFNQQQVRKMIVPEMFNNMLF